MSVSTMAYRLTGLLALVGTITATPINGNVEESRLSESTHQLRPRKDWESPAYTWLYQNPLPIPPVKQPKM